MMDWSTIRPINGSQAKGFEELCTQLARSETPGDGRFQPKGTPDGGVECFCVLRNGKEWGWQAKYFTNSPNNSQWGQINKSVETALKTHPSLVKYFVCVPCNLPDARSKCRISAMERWNNRVRKWEEKANSLNMQVEFVWWGESELLDRLSKDEHRGRVFFWFGRRVLDESWLGSRLKEAHKAAGPRYTPEIHVDLPIARDLEMFSRTGLAIDNIKMLARKVREKVRTVDYVGYNQKNSEHSPSKEDISNKIKIVLEKLSELVPSPDGNLPFQDVSAHIYHAEVAVSEYFDRLAQHFQKEEQQSNGEGQQPWEDVRFDPRQNILRAISQLSDELRITRTAIDRANKIANNQLMIISGKAGAGKTHLLCDFAKRQIDSGVPVLLLMGQRFLSHDDPWSQARSHLDLSDISLDVFVGALEAAAQVAGRRALLITDALNEGAGPIIWNPHLEAFLSPLQQSPWVGVILSIRSNFEDTVIPEGIRNRAVCVTHRGFGDHDYDAVRTFFLHYALDLPSGPILQQEFRNPLFLKMVCEGLSRSGERRLPLGFHGFSKVYNLYLRGVNEHLAKSIRYDSREQKVQLAVQKITQRVADVEHLTNGGRRCLVMSDVKAIVNDLLPDRDYQESLYFGMVSEGVLIEDILPNDSVHEHIVYIAYERFADHAIIDTMLERCSDSEALGEVFRQGGELAFINDGNAFMLNGLIEALCIQIPERTGKELVELVPELRDHWRIFDAFRESLVWRKSDAFSDTTFQLLRKLFDARFEYDETMDTILTVATLTDHPCNADFLDEMLRQYSMPDRDASWSIYLHRAWGRKGAVDKLVDWASKVSSQTELEDRLVELCGIALVWMLTTSNRPLRDRVTKALVSLLTGRLKSLQFLIGRFADIDDLYVSERIYAVAYGVAMRTDEVDQLAAVATEVYQQVFASGSPPAHILLRDYARGVIERALYLDANLEIDQNLICPPYGSKWPEITSEEEFQLYLSEQGLGTREDRMSSPMKATISHSVLYNDFARYVIGTNSNMMNWLSLRLNEAPWRSSDVRMNLLLPTLNEASQIAWEQCKEEEVKLNTISSRELWRILRRYDESQPLIREDISEEKTKSSLDVRVEEFKKGLTTKQRAEVEAILSQRYTDGVEQPPRFDLKLVQRYVLKRVFDLGWTDKRFGDFDRTLVGYGRASSKPERIGKKYQWVAYHEILAYISDHYQYLPRYEQREQVMPYEGPWQDSSRGDIDPSIILTSKVGGDREWNGREPTWWVPENYTKWLDDGHAYDWARSVDDIPDMEKLMILRNNTKGTDWFNLNSHVCWQKPLSIDVDPWGVQQQELWLFLTSYFVRVSDAGDFIAWTKDVNFMGRWMPESPGTSDMFLGEYVWAPAFNYFNRVSPDRDGWTRPGQDCPICVRPAAFRYSACLSGFDCSVERDCGLQLPRSELIDRLNLKWAGEGADFVDSNSKLATCDPSASESGPSALLVRHDLLRRYLDEVDLALCWTVLGQKMIINPGGEVLDPEGGVQFSGAYILTDQGPEGDLNYWLNEKRLPSKQSRRKKK